MNFKPKSSPLEYSKNILGSYQNLDKVSIAGLIVALQLFVLLSARHIWENEAIQDMFMMYFVMMAFTFALLGTDNPFFKITIRDGVTQFVVAFVLGVYAFSALGFGGSVGYGGFGSLGLLIIAQAVVVGTVEESMFRGAIPEALDKGEMAPNVSRLISAAAFAGFHVYVYEFQFGLLLAAFAFGLLMQYIWDGGSVESSRSGYPLMACGLHAAWNTVVLAGSMSLWPFNPLTLGGM
ncbi:CPBP family intramembrane metalloprotease [Methanococcoides sp. SA1]|nr:CPBP family intramembrane metalloprotease [Methanococcoides sp. SA1]